MQAVASMIKSLEIPDEEEEKPRVIAFMCENDAYPALDMAGINGLSYSADVRLIPVRCLGSMNAVWVGDALASGFDGVILIGAQDGPIVRTDAAGDPPLGLAERHRPPTLDRHPPEPIPLEPPDLGAVGTHLDICDRDQALHARIVQAAGEHGLVLVGRRRVVVAQDVTDHLLDGARLRRRVPDRGRHVETAHAVGRGDHRNRAAP